MRKLFSILLMLVVIGPFALANELDQRGMLWITTNFSGKFSHSKIKYLSQLQARFLDEDPVFTEGILRLGLGYSISHRTTLWFGYDIRTIRRVSESGVFWRQRFWQQAIWHLVDTNKLLLSSRTRLEQRDSFHAPGIAVRFRQQLAIHFLNALKNKITPVLSDEIFVSLNQTVWAQPKTFDQNRLFLGIEIPVHESNFLHLGYINRVASNSRNYVMDHILWISYDAERDF